MIDKPHIAPVQVVIDENRSSIKFVQNGVTVDPCIVLRALNHGFRLTYKQATDGQRVTSEHWTIVPPE